MAKSKRKAQVENSKSRLHTELVSIFTNSAFEHIVSEGVQVAVNGRKGEFDGIFVYENVVVLSEETTDNDPKKHLVQKADFYLHCQKNTSVLINELLDKFPLLAKQMQDFRTDEIRVIFTYFSLHEISDEYKDRYPQISAFFNQNTVAYFQAISKIIKKSSRFELLKFLGVNKTMVGSTSSQSEAGKSYKALMLPPASSGLSGSQVAVSFLIDPATLIEQSYVLRKDGWQDRDGLYQRMLVKKKIEGMREYLSRDGRSFLNNIIITLPSSVVIRKQDGSTLSDIDSPSNLKEPVLVQIPDEWNNIGIIDGQHRVFSYHEGTDQFESKISTIRKRQHLLVTGLIYPSKINEEERLKFEAKLFLEINDKQTRTRSSLRQVIAAIAEPFTTNSIARAVMDGLSESGPMEKYVERHFADKGLLKTASIVSYGLSKLVKLDATDSLFQVWDDPQKELIKQEDGETLKRYIRFCIEEVTRFLVAFKKNISHELWTLDQKKSKVLTTTTLIGLIICFKKIIESNQTRSLEYYEEGFKGISTKIDFSVKSKYRSSHWRELGEDIYKACFLPLQKT